MTNWRPYKESLALSAIIRAYIVYGELEQKFGIVVVDTAYLNIKVLSTIPGQRKSN